MKLKAKFKLLMNKINNTKFAIEMRKTLQECNDTQLEIIQIELTKEKNRRKKVLDKQKQNKR